MNSLNTSGDLPGPSTDTQPTQPKSNQPKTPSTHSSPSQPLKFRSFDAFYQHYSKKQNSQAPKATTLSHQSPSNDSAVNQTQESSKRNPKHQSDSSKPTVTYTTEDYDIKGRVKRLCEIFQKARDDSAYRAQLEKVISKNKNSKLLRSLQSDSTHDSESSSSSESLYTQNYDFSSNFSSFNDLKLPHAKQAPHLQIYIKRDPNSRPNTSLSPLKFKSDLISSGYEDSIFNTELKLDNPPREPPSDTHKYDAPSPKAASPLKSSSFVTDRDVPTIEEMTNILATHRINPDSLEYHMDTPRFGTDSSDNKALVDDILNRFMNDSDFCDSFFTKLDSLNLATDSSAMQFSSVIDELQFLVENDSSETQSPMETDARKKNFQWFFNKPEVYEFEVSDPEANKPSPTLGPSTFYSSKYVDEDPEIHLLSPKDDKSDLPTFKESEHSRSKMSFPGEPGDHGGQPEDPDDEDKQESDDDFNSDLAKHFEWVKLTSSAEPS